MSTRGAWSSKAGFILAGAGSAVGLGNIWRFPYMTGDNGGAIFVLVFLAFCFLLGYPVMIAELTLGRHTEKNPVGMFNSLSGGRPLWKLVGGLCVLSGFTIFSWYSVIAGWVVGYVYKTAVGAFETQLTNEAIDTIFSNFVSNSPVVMLLHAVMVFMAAFVVAGGVKGGIEKFSKWLMPILFALLILLAIRSVTLDGAMEGLKFYLYPDFSKVSGIMVLKAMGQALFSLSLGMGTMITYGSYLSKKENIATSAAWITSFDILVSVLAGFVILPAVAAMHQSYAQGPDLIFKVLPSIFGSMPGGYFFGLGFFTLVIIAALTSTVSILEVPVSYFVDERGWTRKKAVALVACSAWLIGIPAALSYGATDFLTRLPGIGASFFDVISTAFGDISLSIGAFFIAVFVAWVWGVAKASKEIESEGNSFALKAPWSFLIRFVAPITILIVFLYTIWATFLSS
ncbi:MAG TPA: sodium-dependent transporter [Acidobacteriota bacterium]|nr:sodium-dependent transporter [Acidobacteriota bacterium]